MSTVCKTGFSDLEELLLDELPKLAECTDAQGNPSLNGEVRIGQLEMLMAMIKLSEELVGFGFFVDLSESNISLQSPYFAKISRISSALFAVLDMREQSTTKSEIQDSKKHRTYLFMKTHPSDSDEMRLKTDECRKIRYADRAVNKAVEARLRCDLQYCALQLLMRLFDVRLNWRMTQAIETWEAIFEKIQHGPGGLSRLKNPYPVMRSVMSNGSCRSHQIAYNEDEFLQLTGIFKNFEVQVGKLENVLFGTHVVNPPEVGTDVYAPGSFDDNTIQVMFDLCSFRHQAMTKSCMSLLIRHMSQRVTLMTALKEMQILVFPSAANVYNETQIVVKKLSGMHKHINSDYPGAYKVSISLLDRMTTYLAQCTTNKREVVHENQSIMLNLDIEVPVRNLLSLYLARDKRSDLEADLPLNILRRNLFQSCYTFLKHLAWHNPKAQKRLFQYVQIFAENMGVKPFFIIFF